MLSKRIFYSSSGPHLALFISGLAEMQRHVTAGAVQWRRDKGIKQLMNGCGFPSSAHPEFV